MLEGEHPLKWRIRHSRECTVLQSAPATEWPNARIRTHLGLCIPEPFASDFAKWQLQIADGGGIPADVHLSEDPAMKDVTWAWGGRVQVRADPADPSAVPVSAQPSQSLGEMRDCVVNLMLSPADSTLAESELELMLVQRSDIGVRMHFKQIRDLAKRADISLADRWLCKTVKEGLLKLRFGLGNEDPSHARTTSIWKECEEMRSATIQELEVAALKAETAIASSVAPYRHSAYNVKLRAAALRQVGPSLSRAQVSPVMLALGHGEQESQGSPVTWPPGHAGSGEDTDDEVQLLSWARQVRADNQARSASSTSQVAP